MLILVQAGPAGLHCALERKVMNRREIRENVFKMLFRVEFYKGKDGYKEEELKEQLGMFEYELKLENDPDSLSEEAAGAQEDPQAAKLLAADRERLNKDMAYITSKYTDIMAHIEEIDLAINQVTTGWKTSRMAKVDLSIIRLAVYEIRYEEDIPVKVSINEAVELAKKYGSDDSAAFVNGILAKFTR